MIRSFAVVLLRGWTRRSSSAWPKTKGFATGGSVMTTALAVVAIVERRPTL